MIFEPPTQPAVEVELAFLRSVLAVARQGVVAGLVQMGIAKGDRVVRLAQIARIDIDKRA